MKKPGFMLGVGLNRLSALNFGIKSALLSGETH